MTNDHFTENPNLALMENQKERNKVLQAQNIGASTSSTLAQVSGLAPREVKTETPEK